MLALSFYLLNVCNWKNFHRDNVGISNVTIVDGLTIDCIKSNFNLFNKSNWVEITLGKEMRRIKSGGRETGTVKFLINRNHLDKYHFQLFESPNDYHPFFKLIIYLLMNFHFKKIVIPSSTVNCAHFIKFRRNCIFAFRNETHNHRRNENPFFIWNIWVFYAFSKSNVILTFWVKSPRRK